MVGFAGEETSGLDFGSLLDDVFVEMEKVLGNSRGDAGERLDFVRSYLEFFVNLSRERAASRGVDSNVRNRLWLVLSEYEQNLPFERAVAVADDVLLCFNKVLWRSADRGEQETLFEWQSWFVTSTATVKHTIAKFYAVRAWDTGNAGRGYLADKLLRGEAITSGDRELGFSLATHYQLLALRFDESMADGHQQQWWRPIQHEHDLLWSVTDYGAVLLVPAPARLDVAQRAEQLALATLGGLRGQAFSALSPLSTVRQLPATALDVARQVRLAEILGHGEVPIRVEDVLVELALQRCPDLTAHAERVIGCLAAKETLMTTFETFLGHDLDRAATASALRIHRRTLDYRLARIKDATGYDPRTFGGARTLAAAHIARRIAAADAFDATATVPNGNGGQCLVRSASCTAASTETSPDP